MLVLVVILLFLQDWRAVLIPATTVPVTIIGAFAAMAALGFSVNMLTLFGLVLAIGIVVDDAIVIVENAAHHIDRGGLPPKQATIRAMSRGDRADHRHHPGPDGGLPAVGVPGRDHRPALPPVRPDDRRDGGHQRHQRGDAQAGAVRRLPPADARRASNVVFRAFNAATTGARRPTSRPSAGSSGTSAPMLVLFAGLAALTGWWFTRLPTGFLPTEDQGYAIVGIQLPDAASQSRTRAVVDAVSAIIKEIPGVESWFLIGGMSILDRIGRLQRGGDVRDLHALVGPDGPPRPEPGGDHRRDRGPSAAGSARRSVFAFAPPAIEGLGVAGGFQMQIEDRGGVGPRELQQVVDEMVADGNAQSGPDGAPEQLPRGRADDPRRGRPGEGQEPGRLARRDLRHAPDGAGLGLRQRLQQVRPHLAGPGPGRPEVPPRSRGHPPARGPRPAGEDGPARHAG